MCFYRRNEIPGHLVAHADKHHWGETDPPADADIVDSDDEDRDRVHLWGQVYPEEDELEDDMDDALADEQYLALECFDDVFGTHAGVEAGSADDEEEVDVGVVLGQEQPCTSETCDDVVLLDENTDAENASFDDHGPRENIVQNWEI